MDVSFRRGRGWQRATSPTRWPGWRRSPSRSAATSTCTSSSQPDPVSRDQAAAGRRRRPAHGEVPPGQAGRGGPARHRVPPAVRAAGAGGGPPGEAVPAVRRARSSVSLPERRYDLAGQLMAAAIDESTTAGTPVLDALRPGRGSPRRRPSATRPAAPTDPGDARPRDATCATCWPRHGYEPRAGRRPRHPAQLPVPRAGPGAHRPGLRHEPRPGRRCGRLASTSRSRPGSTPPTAAAASSWLAAQKPITIGPPGRPSPSSTRLQRTHFR